MLRQILPKNIRITLLTYYSPHICVSVNQPHNCAIIISNPHLSNKRFPCTFDTTRNNTINCSSNPYSRRFLIYNVQNYHTRYTYHTTNTYSSIINHHETTFHHFYIYVYIVCIICNKIIAYCANKIHIEILYKLSKHCNILT